MMGFWVFMLVMDLLIPLTMVAFGWLFYKRAPKEINSMFGYRTTMSMKNKDTWTFAHEYFGKIWLACGLALLPISIAVMMFVRGESANTVGIVGGVLCVVQGIPLIGPLFPTERALKKHFDSNGRRRAV